MEMAQMINVHKIHIIYHSMLERINGSRFLSCLPPPLGGAVPLPHQYGSHYGVRKTGCMICNRASFYGLSRRSAQLKDLTGVTVGNEACIHVHISRGKRTADD